MDPIYIYERLIREIEKFFAISEKTGRRGKGRQGEFLPFQITQIKKRVQPLITQKTRIRKNK